MDAALNRPPRRVTDTTELSCKHCDKCIYSEEHVSEVGDDGSTSHWREVMGSFRQVTDASGTPTGPVIPFCDCRKALEEARNAQG